MTFVDREILIVSEKKDFNILRGQHLRVVDDTRQLDT